LNYHAILFLGLAACQSPTLTHIELDYTDTVVVEGSGLLGDLVTTLGFDGFADMNLTENEELANQGVEPGDVRDVRLVAFELEAIQPAGADLSFLSSMRVSAESEGLASVEIASYSDFATGEALALFTIPDVDLTEYIVSESVTLETEVSGELPSDETTIEARVLIDVGVTLKGAINQAKAN
jgi:hypothetical protein